MTPTIDEIMHRAGAFRSGVCHAYPVAPEWQQSYTYWIAAGMHAGMDYLDRYHHVRHNPSFLLQDARSLVVGAFPYFHPECRQNASIAPYAMGSDYHTVLRSRLEDAAREIREIFGGETRVCVDTAPLRERYWAQKCGLGAIGMNGHLIVPGAGSYFFIGTIICTAQLTPTEPLAENPCTECGACVKACPGKAIGTGGKVDARRCISYLTIEHRGDLPEGTDLNGSIYGCDICAQVCPLNADAPRGLPEFQPRPALLALTPQKAAELTQQQFTELFRNSPVKRTKLSGLTRNAKCVLAKSESQNILRKSEAASPESRCGNPDTPQQNHR